uniref:Uncharacterized protein n=1 Tax=Neobodo designis TaxID=312471 RepID=A0A6U4WBS1_NEODS
MDRILKTASRKQRQYWQQRAGQAARQLQDAHEAEKIQSAGARQRFKQKIGTSPSPFSKFVQETMGSREHDVSASLFVQASMLRWQFMSSEERRRFVAKTTRNP